MFKTIKEKYGAWIALILLALALRALTAQPQVNQDHGDPMARTAIQLGQGVMAGLDGH